MNHATLLPWLRARRQQILDDVATLVSCESPSNDLGAVAASAAGALKTARKGISMYRMQVHGKASHAGLEPEAGINATIEAAHQVLAIDALGASAVGTTVTPTVLHSGRTMNTIPDLAEISVDVRAGDPAEQRRVDEAMRGLLPALPGARLDLTGEINRPPLDGAASAGLFALARSLAEGMGLPPLRDAAVGGTPTLDGLGAVGDHAHAEGEWASVAAMADRAALVAALVDAVRSPR